MENIHVYFNPEKDIVDNLRGFKLYIHSEYPQFKILRPTNSDQSLSTSFLPNLIENIDHIIAHLPTSNMLGLYKPYYSQLKDEFHRLKESLNDDNFMMEERAMNSFNA